MSIGAAGAARGWGCRPAPVRHLLPPGAGVPAGAADPSAGGFGGGERGFRGGSAAGGAGSEVRGAAGGV